VKREAPRLNANQRRSVEALLESLESMLAQVERLLPDSAAEGGVISVANDIPDKFHSEAPERIAALRDELRELAATIQVNRRRVSKRRTLRGMLSAQLVRIEDVTPARLRSYGEVHSSFAEEVSPALRRVHRSVQELIDLLPE
jgi:hypothetical protein